MGEIALEGRGFLAAMPTGMGKTTGAIFVASHDWTQGKKTIICVPLKSLNAEHAEKFSSLGFSVCSAYGDERKDKAFFESEAWEECDVLVTTNETLDGILASEGKRELVMPLVGSIVFDEVHHIGEHGRGSVLEGIIAILKANYPTIRIVGLSATIGNVVDIQEFLGSDLVYAPPEARPVPLELSFHDYEKEYWEFSDKIIPNHKANFEKKMDNLEPFMRKHLRDNPDCVFIIFATSRARTVQLANEIAKRIFGYRGRYMGDNKILQMIEQTKIGFHNAGLDAAERKAVETAFLNGEIQCVCATPTLAQGVNLPADVCVIFDAEQWDALHGETIIDANRLQQTIGRAGRPGFSERGFAHIMCPIDAHNEFYSDVPAEIRRRAREPLIIKSQMGKCLHQFILRLVGGNLANDLAGVQAILREAFGKFSDARVAEATSWLERFEFIKCSSEGYEATWWGKMATVFHILPETVREWRAQACSIKDVNDWREIFTRFASVDEYSGIVTVRGEDREKIEVAQQEIGRFFPRERKCKKLCLTCISRDECGAASLEHHTCPIDEFAMRPYVQMPNEICKVFALSFARDIIEKYDLYQKDYRGNYKKDRYGNKRPTLILSKGDSFLLKAAAERMFNAASTLFSYNEKLAATLKDLAFMVKAGTMSTAAAHLQRVKGLGPVAVDNLLRAGINTLGKFISASVEDIARALRKSPRVVRTLQANAQAIA